MGLATMENDQNSCVFLYFVPWGLTLTRDDLYKTSSTLNLLFKIPMSFYRQNKQPILFKEKCHLVSKSSDFWLYPLILNSHSILRRKFSNQQNAQDSTPSRCTINTCVLHCSSLF